MKVDWRKEIWYIHTMEYYSAIRKDEILPFATTWMDFQGIMPSKISQMEKNKNHMISLMCISVHSPWLPGDIDVIKTVLGGTKMEA